MKRDAGQRAACTYVIFDFTTPSGRRALFPTRRRRFLARSTAAAPRYTVLSFLLQVSTKEGRVQHQALVDALCRCPRGRIQALSSSFRGAHTSCSRPARCNCTVCCRGVTGDHAQAPLAPAARRHRAHRSSADNSPRGLIFSHELARGTPRRYPYTRPRSRPSISRWSCRACAPDTTNQPTLVLISCRSGSWAMKAPLR